MVFYMAKYAFDSRIIDFVLMTVYTVTSKTLVRSMNKTVPQANILHFQ